MHTQNSVVVLFCLFVFFFQFCANKLSNFLSVFMVFSYRNGEPDFLYARTWIPWFFFSGVVTFGTIGRQLAMVRVSYCLTSF